MNKSANVFCVVLLIAAAAFTLSLFADPAEAAGVKLTEQTETEMCGSDFAVEKGAEIDFKSETEVFAGLDTPVSLNASETASETIFGTNSKKSENASATSAPKMYYEIPLSRGLQDLIFDECERYGLSPQIVIALIERESRFDTYALGDDGRAFGLMQVQPKRHLRRMIDMGCTNLFDPYQNVKVGIAVLGELKYRRNDICWALTAYNSGEADADKGINDYALSVIEQAGQIEKMRCYNG